MILFYIPWNGSKCRSWFHQKTWKEFCTETSYYAGNMNQLLLLVLIRKNQFLWIIFSRLEGAIFCVMLILRSLDSVFCIISFILIYFSMISIALWCTVLMYAWNISFKSLSTTKDVISGKVRYFHFIVWFFAIVLTNLVLLLQQVSDITSTRFFLVNGPILISWKHQGV